MPEAGIGKLPVPRDRILELRRVPAAELIPNPRRWRRHPEAQRRALAEVVERIGYADACLAREQAGGGLVLIDGHLRSELRPEDLIPVLVLDLSEAESDVLLATLDPLAGMAEAAEEALRALLERAVLPEDLLDYLSRRYPGGEAAEGLTDPEAIPARPFTAGVRRGQAWALGRHRLACGDARDPAELTRLLAGERADVLWTDPPYGVSYVGKTPRALRIANDDAEGLKALVHDAFAAVDAVLRPGARVYVCHPAGPASILFAEAFAEVGWRLHETLVWVKDRMVLGHADYHYRHEPILYGYKPGPGRWGRGHRGWYGGNAEDSVLEVPRPAASREHPTSKPVELVRRCLANSSREGQRVLDPFAGSGSTLIACEELGRRAYLLELDPGYCEVAISRWQDYTGGWAVPIDA